MPHSNEARLDEITPHTVKNLPWFQPFDAAGLSLAAQIPLQTLWHHTLTAHAQYTVHRIPKKSGGTRTLHEPSKQLAWVQRQLLRCFLDQYPWPAHVSAYVTGRNTLAAAVEHANRPVLIVVDIKDFFPSTKRSWVKKAVMAELNLGEQAADVFAALVSCPWTPTERKHYCVPQGAPTSGAVANLVAVHRLDPRILRVCAEFGMTYTRYADDLAFSRAADLSKDDTSRFIRAIMRAIYASGYWVNRDKIRVQRRNQQQRLLGLTLNAFPNIPYRRYKQMRALAHQAGQCGYEEVAKRWGFADGHHAEAYLDGICAYFQGINPNKAHQLRKFLPCDTTPTQA